MEVVAAGSRLALWLGFRELCIELIPQIKDLRFSFYVEDVIPYTITAKLVENSRGRRPRRPVLLV